jgi:heme-degrading monooxygenase HmoA
MAIRVIIQRVIESGQEAKIQQLLTQLRSKATQVKGYISGETLRDINNPQKFLVISTWNSLEDWKAWENNPERKQLREQLNKALRSDEDTAIYGHI